ncbi:alpha-tocopherol transfer protein-like [Gigantopelta aegis]|uniref:alpha-tocopherol transfer protein-like n=1 Tax=Gigantopelta aegis TaxID=1735272 RepID=UPI001B887A47|nr:alpha-tocopherol transfer protein-like [Gigantopelta aegis]XP_041355747.1 alpha-tocopherol transfer protein-like [Gigantopelta aegis]XP_041355748.1 alpha-tocopherol transfer protein-like [Gigantopelta aegis]XP_041355749.1 alpha-tocopherol transfer protein-like [Gigantopelta aegis]
MSNGYVCTLSPACLERAKAELCEDPNTRKQEINAFRERLLRLPGLNCRTDSLFLLRFLRAKKFDQERSFTLIINYYKRKLEKPDLYATLLPSSIQHVLENDFIVKLDGKDKEGSPVLFYRPGLWDPDKYPAWDILKTSMIIMSKLLEEEDVQVTGVRFLTDLKDFHWQHVKNMPLDYLKFQLSWFQDSMPLRYKGFHNLHEHAVFYHLFTLMKHLMSEKLKSRIFLHGSKVEELLEFIDKDVLPEEYGGTGPPLSGKAYTKVLLESEQDFKEEMRYGFVDMTMHKDNKSKQSEDAMENLSGTYRKLDID